jgi:methionine sulfoxide reductase heme-binding subunit
MTAEAHPRGEAARHTGAADGGGRQVRSQTPASDEGRQKRRGGVVTWANGLRVAVHLGGLWTFAKILWDGYSRHLTVNPIKELTHRTGDTALILLVLTLACTPVNTVFGWRWTVPIRRTLGLYCFFYAVLHFSIFIADTLVLVDYPLSWRLIYEAYIEKRYIVAGFTAFLLLIPLAITSTKGWQRRLRRGWGRLHRVVYFAAGLAVLHFLWFAKGGADRIEPLEYGAVVAVLLGLRLPWVRRTIQRWRNRGVVTRAQEKRVPPGVERPAEQGV